MVESTTIMAKTPTANPISETPAIILIAWVLFLEKRYRFAMKNGILKPI